MPPQIERMKSFVSHETLDAVTLRVDGGEAADGGVWRKGVSQMDIHSLAVRGERLEVRPERWVEPTVLDSISRVVEVDDRPVQTLMTDHDVHVDGDSVVPPIAIRVIQEVDPLDRHDRNVEVFGQTLEERHLAEIAGQVMLIVAGRSLFELRKLGPGEQSMLNEPLKDDFGRK